MTWFPCGGRGVSPLIRQSHRGCFISKVKNPAVDLGCGSRSRVQRTFWSQQCTRINEWMILLHFRCPYLYSYLILVIIVDAQLLSRVWLCDPMDCSPPSSSVHGVLQVRILEWVAISFSGGSSLPRDWTCISQGFCIGRWVLYHCTTWEALRNKLEWLQTRPPRYPTPKIFIFPVPQWRC